MKSKSSISLGEQKIIQCGLYVTCPINLQILLTKSELCILNSIRHSQNLGHRRISISALRIMTGLTEKTIKAARNSLIELGFIEQYSVTPVGTEYHIKFSKLCKCLGKINCELNPVGRLILADEFRGKGKEIHRNTIEAFLDSEFNKSI